MDKFQNKQNIQNQSTKGVDQSFNASLITDPTGKEQIEDVTMYGEMIPSLYNWINPQNQMERVREIDNRVKEQTRKQNNNH